jgi:autotransporter translocation and assembly factor TamB
MSMASRVGLDDARIEAGARQQDAAFYAGKYLSPQLYVAYGSACSSLSMLSACAT